LSQVTYNGKPLYYYEKDSSPGDTKGEGAKQYGAEWYLVSPGGGKQEGKERGKSQSRTLHRWRRASGTSHVSTVSAKLNMGRATFCLN
jgi:hypothetical protein